MPAAARPAALKLLNGRTGDTDSGGRKVAPPVAFARNAPTAPSWLPREAAEEWRRIVPELSRMRLAKDIDRGSLAAYCLSWARFAHLSKEWDQTGRVSTAQVEAASRELRQWAREFGLTPSSESALHPPELPDVGDPFA